MGHSKGSPEREVHSDAGLPKKDRNIQIKNLILHLLEEQQQRQPRASRRKEITKITAELNNIETKSTILRINESSSCFFENINKVKKTLSRFIKKKREGTQQRIVRYYYEELHAKKLEDLGEMDKFLEKYNVTKPNEEDAESLNRPITANKIEA